MNALLRARKYGEVSEWFKELVLKTSDSERDRGFESHLLRFNWNIALYSGIIQNFRDSAIWRSTQAGRRDTPGKGAGR